MAHDLRSKGGFPHYEAVPTPEIRYDSYSPGLPQQQYGSPVPQQGYGTPPPQQYEQQAQYGAPSPIGYMDEAAKPQRLDGVWSRLFRALIDLLLAVVALLFLIFGFLVYKNDGKEPTPGSTAAEVVSAAKYGPTIFPIIFAAIVGGGMKAVATWRIQRGTSIGFIEQLLGSRSVSGAFTTQIQLRAINVSGLLIIILWCLSPLGSQASLRVAEIVQSYPHTSSTLKSINPFSEYRYGNAEGISEATTLVLPSFIAAMMSVNLLNTRNQDLWGNIRLPSIERLAPTTETGWINVTDSAKLEYPSLIGLPISPVAETGNTTFTLSASYLNVTCGVIKTQGPDFTNFSDPSIGPLSLSGGVDCSWYGARASGAKLQLAMSQPCSGVDALTRNDARKLVLETYDGLVDDVRSYTHAECDLWTTYVDVNIQCTGKTCSPLAIRRTPNTSRSNKTTVFDLGSGWLDTTGFLLLFAQTFPTAGLSGTRNPLRSYFVDPLNAITSTNDTAVYKVGKENIEMRLAQLLNTQLLIGISSSEFTGTFDPAKPVHPEDQMEITATNQVEETLVRCNKVWLVLLAVASLVLFLFGLVAAVIRFNTLAPDILGTLSLALLRNKCQTLMGNSTWSGSERARKMKNVKIRFGDIQPEAGVGRLAIVAPLGSAPVDIVQKRRVYV